MADYAMLSADKPPSQRMIEQIVEDRIRQARKDNVLDLYENLLTTIWDRIHPTLGRVSVMAILGRALVLSRENYPLLQHVHVITTGIDLSTLRQQIGAEELDVIRSALKEFIANLIDILVMLTGDILVRQLLQEIQGRTQA